MLSISGSSCKHLWKLNRVVAHSITCFIREQDLPLEASAWEPLLSLILSDKINTIKKCREGRILGVHSLETFKGQHATIIPISPNWDNLRPPKSPVMIWVWSVPIGSCSEHVPQLVTIFWKHVELLGGSSLLLYCAVLRSWFQLCSISWSVLMRRHLSHTPVTATKLFPHHGQLKPSETVSQNKSFSPWVDHSMQK